MTKKEAFEIICNTIEKYDRKSYQEAIEIIRKELLMTEMLKPLLEVKENTKTTLGNIKYFLKFKEGVVLNDASLEILKGWLDNDK